MGFIGETAEIPAGVGGLALDRSPLDAQLSDLLLAEGLDESAGSARKEGGARLLDSAGLAGSPAAGTQLSVARAWRSFIAVLRAEDTDPPVHIKTFNGTRGKGVSPQYQGVISPTIDNGGTPVAHQSSWVGTLAAYPAKPGETPSAGTLVGTSTQFPPFTSKTFSHVLAGGIAAGTLLVVRVAWMQGPQLVSTLGVADTAGGNTYKLDASYTQAVSGVPGYTLVSRIYSCLVTTPLSPGHAIGLGFNVNVDCELSVVSHTGATNAGTLQTAVSRISDLGGAYVPTMVAAEPPAWPVLRVAHVVDRNQYSSTPGAVIILTDIAINYVRHASEGQRSLAWAAMSRVETEDRIRLIATVPVGGIALGNTLLVHVAYDNRNPALVPSISISDSRGNAYTEVVHTDTAAAGNVSALFVAVNVNAMLAGDEIVVRMDVPGLARSVIVSEFSDVAVTDPVAAFAIAAATAPGSDIITLVAPHVTGFPLLIFSGGSWLQTTDTTVTANGAATIPVNGTALINELRSYSQYEVLADEPDKIVALADWHPGDGLPQRIVSVTSQGRVYKSNTAMTDIDSVLLDILDSESAARAVFVHAGKEAAGNPRSLFIFNGVDLPVVLNGDDATTHTIAGPPIDWSSGNRPTNGIHLAERLWTFGNRNFPHSVYVSALGDHEDFTTDPLGGPLQGGIGEKLVAAIQFANVAYFFKYPRGILKMDTSDPDFRNWFLNGVGVFSEALGVADSPFAVLAIDTDAIFVTKDCTFHKLSAIDSPTGTASSDLTDALALRRGLRALINMERLGQMRSAWYPQQKWALFALPSAGSEVNDLLLKFDMSAPRVRVTLSRRDIHDALTMWRDSTGVDRPLIAEGAFVYELDRPERTKNGALYDSVYQTPHLDFGKVLDTSGTYGDEPSDPFAKTKIRSKRKNWDSIDVIQRPTTEEGFITVETFLDEQETATQTLTFATHISRQRKRMIGNSRTASVKVSGRSDFDVLSVLLGLRLSDEDVNRPRRAPTSSVNVLPIPVNATIGDATKYLRFAGSIDSVAETLEEAEIVMPLDAVLVGMSMRLLDAPGVGQAARITLVVNEIERSTISLTANANERDVVALVGPFILSTGDFVAWKVTTSGGFTTQLLSVMAVFKAAHKFTAAELTAAADGTGQLFAGRMGGETIEATDVPAVELNPLPVTLAISQVGMHADVGPDSDVDLQPRAGAIDQGTAATLLRGSTARVRPVTFTAPAQPATLAGLDVARFAVAVRPEAAVASVIAAMWKYRPVAPMEQWQVLAAGWSDFVLDGDTTEYLSFGAVEPSNLFGHRAELWPVRGRFQHCHVVVVFDTPQSDDTITVSLRQNDGTPITLSVANDAAVKFARDDSTTFNVLPGDYIAVQITTDGLANVAHRARVYLAVGFITDTVPGIPEELVAEEALAVTPLAMAQSGGACSAWTDPGFVVTGALGVVTFVSIEPATVGTEGTTAINSTTGEVTGTPVVAAQNWTLTIQDDNGLHEFTVVGSGPGCFLSRGVLAIVDDAATYVMNTTTAAYASLAIPVLMGSTPGAVYVRAPVDMVITSMAALLSVALGVGGSVTFRITVNGVDSTAVQATIASGGTEDVDDVVVAAGITVAQDDLIAIHAVFTGTPTSATVRAITLGYAVEGIA
jgi:hypothetical protein